MSLLNLVAATSSYYTTTHSGLTDAEATGILGLILALGIGIWLFALALIVFMIIVKWKIYTKAGKPGWYSIVPFLTDYTMAEICGIKGWFGLAVAIVPFVTLIPVAGWIVDAAIAAFAIFEIVCFAKVFGKDTAYIIGLIFLSPIFMAIIAFGNSQYLGAGASPAKTTFLASDDAKKGDADVESKPAAN